MDIKRIEKYTVGSIEGRFEMASSRSRMKSGEEPFKIERNLKSDEQMKRWTKSTKKIFNTKTSK